jgi:hypothetical protein
MLVKTCVDSISRSEGERKMAESILKKKMGIEKEIDDFLNQVSEAGLLCRNGMGAWKTLGELGAVNAIAGVFVLALVELSPAWRMKPGDKEHNNEVMADPDYVYRLIRATD